jgi:hypothetical protein
VRQRLIALLAEGPMPPNSELPGNFTPEVVEALERAFEDVWTVLQAHLDPGSEDGTELGSTISRTLVALAATGITDRQELRRQALGTMPLTPR